MTFTVRASGPGDADPGVRVRATVTFLDEEGNPRCQRQVTQGSGKPIRVEGAFPEAGPGRVRVLATSDEGLSSYAEWTGSVAPAAAAPAVESKRTGS